MSPYAIPTVLAALVLIFVVLGAIGLRAYLREQKLEDEHWLAARRHMKEDDFP